MSNLQWMQTRTATLPQDGATAAWAEWGFDIGMPSVTGDRTVAAATSVRVGAERRSDGR
jgi:hypothetical protein